MLVSKGAGVGGQRATRISCVSGREGRGTLAPGLWAVIYGCDVMQ